MKLHDSGSRAANGLPSESRPEAATMEGSPAETETLESEEATGPVIQQPESVLRPDDFVFLSGKGNCWLVRTADIWLLEAHGGRTRVFMPGGAVVVRRTLSECERRLDASAFFRATRDCIINLMHVKQTRLLDCSRVAFVLPNNKQIIVSGKQNAFFRKMRAL
jgi:DNA-binding LytR/AlgR family response regulator